MTAAPDETIDGVRTFHARRGRLGPRAKDALHRLLPRYGIAEGGAVVAPGTLFEPEVPVVVELGCGRGEATVAIAREQPHVGVIAVDVHDAGIATLVADVAEAGLTNVRICHGDGVLLLRRRIPSNSLVGIRAFFPDPWPKARHHKRRLVRPDLVALMADRLAPGGTLHVATDWQPYADEMIEVLSREPRLRSCSPTGFVERPSWRPLTAYECKALQAGRPTSEVLFRRR